MRIGMKMPAFAAAAACAAAVGGLAWSGEPADGGAPGTRTSEMTSGGRGAGWERLPALPNAASVDIDGASMVVADGGVHVLVVDRSDDETSPSEVSVFRLEGNRWEGPVGGRTLPANRGAQVVMTGGEAPCVVVPLGRTVQAQCVRGDDWEDLGNPVFATTFPEPVTTFGGAFRSARGLIVARARLADARSRFGGVAVQGRLEHHLYGLSGGTWRDLGGDLDASAPGGSQRPFGVDYKGRTCVAYDRIARSRRTGPTVVVRCLARDRWRHAGVPPLRNRSRERRSAINVDGAAASGGHLYVGLDVFGGSRVRWRVMDFDGRRWASLPATSPGSAWNDQGSIYTIGGRVIVVVFGQRQSATGLRTRLRVLELGADRRWHRLGGELVRDAAFHGPLYWGVVGSGSSLYTLATVPAVDGSPRNEIGVFRRPAP